MKAIHIEYQDAAYLLNLNYLCFYINFQFDSGGRKHKHRFFKEMKEELEKLQDDDSANYHHEAFKIKKHLPKSYRYLVDLYDKYKSTKEIMVSR